MQSTDNISSTVPADEPRGLKRAASPVAANLQPASKRPRLEEDPLPKAPLSDAKILRVAHNTYKSEYEGPVGKKAINDWFGEAGCFLGGLPFCDAASMVSPEKTPFEYLIVVNPKDRERCPIVAMLLKPRASRGDTICDAMDIICDDESDPRLRVFIMDDPDHIPEAYNFVAVDEFLAEFGGEECTVLVGPADNQVSPNIEPRVR